MECNEVMGCNEAGGTVSTHCMKIKCFSDWFPQAADLTGNTLHRERVVDKEGARERINRLKAILKVEASQHASFPVPAQLVTRGGLFLALTTKPDTPAFHAAARAGA